MTKKKNNPGAAEFRKILDGREIEAAQKLGVSESLVRSLELGHRHPGLALADVIEREYGVKARLWR